MFDVSFSEVVVIFVVALVVLGPERLPRVARTAGHLLGRFQRYVYQVKYEINQEMHVEDLKKFNADFQSSVSQVEGAIDQQLRDIQNISEPIAVEVQSTETLLQGDTNTTVCASSVLAAVEHDACVSQGTQSPPVSPGNKHAV